MKKKRTLKFVAMVNGIVGVSILGAVFAPMIIYELSSRVRYPDLLSPIPAREEKRSFVGFSKLDYTKASNWFADDTTDIDFGKSSVDFYTITIPNLGIKSATAAIGGEDLAESLIHYPGTSLPGKNGNSVIFGHSILPQFFNPEDYLSMFSTLPELADGDEILVDYDGISYRYVVEDIFEVKPTDVEILSQDKSDSFLTLVTCVPPGHPLRPKRLIVRARITPKYEAFRN